VWGIERLLFDTELGQTLARHGRHKVEKRFGWNTVAARIEQALGVKQPS
jgi:hypothetical protein